MQFYLNGYRAGDPEDLEPAPGAQQGPDDLPGAVDVLIIGCGPAGLVLAAQLAAFPGIRTRIVERRPGPLELGQADGVACRSVEMFEALGFSERLLREAYWVNETVFWKPDPEDPARIKRSGRIQDTEDGLSEMPHVIVNQARVHQYLLDLMKLSATKLEPNYNLQVSDIRVGETGDYPVTVTLQQMRDFAETGDTRTVKARYVVGCDGARSRTRAAIGRELKGDLANQAWGVMDVLAVTDFPDIRLKAAIHSADQGNILIIPREGGYLVRFYIELDELAPDQHLSRDDVTPDKLIDAMNRIMHPYRVDVKDIAWWSVYEIGQRLTDKFDDVPAEQTDTRLPRVFIAGDACHTHSAKAGQGMNVSMADTFNLGWKLINVLRGTARPELLHSYSAERQKIAKQLIDFDREFAKMFSARPKAAGDRGEGVDPQEFQSYFVAQGRFTAGVATRYEPSMIVAAPTFQHLAEGFTVGMRLHSAPVIRLVDAKPVQLAHGAKADGAWRVYAFADEKGPLDRSSRIHGLCEFFASAQSPLRRFTPAGGEVDAVIDFRAVFQQGHRDLPVERMHPVLLPKKGRFGLADYEKMFCPDLKAADDIFALRKVNRELGCMLVVRPDQYVAHILPLNAHDALNAFFEEILVEARGRHG